MRHLRLTLPLLFTLVATHFASAETFTVTSTEGSGPGTLLEAVNLANANEEADIIDFAVSNTINLSSRLSVRSDITIIGPGADHLTITLAEPVFFIDGGNLTISGVTISSNGLLGSRGGSGGTSGRFAGGGGAGMGGGIFVNSGSLTATGVSFIGCIARGGDGGDQAANGEPSGGGGGSALFSFRGEDAQPDRGGDGGSGGAGGANGAPSSGNGNPGLPGEDSFGFGGGGGGGAGSNAGSAPIRGLFGGNGGNGGNGGFGGGGGGAGAGGNELIRGAGPGADGTGGNGGFGGGGGGSAGAIRSFVVFDNGGQFGGGGSLSGGGGAGLGGAIFVREGARATISFCNFDGNQAIAGAGGTSDGGAPGASGQAKGGAIFAMDGAEVSVTSSTFSNNVAADAGTEPGDNANMFGTQNRNLTVNTAFTYQGQLNDGGSPASGLYNFKFMLFDEPTGGMQLGPQIQRNNYVVENGLFEFDLDFSDLAFDGGRRWLQVAVELSPPTRSGGQRNGSFTDLVPRREIFPAPQAQFALIANEVINPPLISSLAASDGDPSIPVNVDADGNLGVGTDNPAETLEVLGEVRISSLGDSNNQLEIFSSNVYQHSVNPQTFGTDIGRFIIGSREGLSESAGIYGDGNAITIWAPGDGQTDAGVGAAYIFVVDEDQWGDDGNPYNNNALRAYLDSAGVWQTSDATRKANIAKVESAGDKISRLNGYTYEYKLNDTERTKGQEPQRVGGFLAQELNEVLPEAVNVSTEGQYFVNYVIVLPLLVEALKEEQAKVRALEAQNAELDARLDRIEEILAESLRVK